MKRDHHKVTTMADDPERIAAVLELRRRPMRIRDIVHELSISTCDASYIVNTYMDVDENRQCENALRLAKRSNGTEPARMIAFNDTFQRMFCEAWS